MKSTAPTQPSNRSSRLFVRLTDDERASLEREAHAAGLTLSDYVRSRVIRNQGPSPRSAMARAARPSFVAMSPPLFAELSRIGNNLNQLARAFNRGRDIDRGDVVRLSAEVLQTLLADEVTARYATVSEAKVRGRRPQ